MFVTDISLLSVQDYHRMVEARVLAPDERVELISGQLYKMAPPMLNLAFKTTGF